MARRSVKLLGFAVLLAALLVAGVTSTADPAWLVALITDSAIVRGAYYWNQGRAENCSLWESINGFRHRDQLIEVADRMRGDARMTRREDGLELWETPDGPYWAPAGSDVDGILGMIAEQQLDIYGAGEQSVQPGDIVLDGGANIGVFVREALGRGAELVVAIDLSPGPIECLRRNFSQEIYDGRVIVYPKGVWDKDAELEISTSGNSWAHSVARGTGTITAPLTTIDKIVAELALPRVDYIKMDVEGSEARAIAGARETLERFRPRMSICAYHNGGDDYQAILSTVAEVAPFYSADCLRCKPWDGAVMPDVVHFAAGN